MEKVRDQRQKAATGQWQCSWQLHWTELLIRYGSLETKGCIPDREEKHTSGELPTSQTPKPTASELCECCRSHTVLSIHGNNRISSVSSQVQTEADWKTNKNRICIWIQGIRVSSGTPVGYRCLNCALMWHKVGRFSKVQLRLRSHKLKASWLWSILVVYIKELKRKVYIYIFFSYIYAHTYIYISDHISWSEIKK